MSGSFGLFEKAKAKLQHDLTPDEFATLDRCGKQVRTDARIGSMIGAVVAILGMRRRKLWPLTKFPGRALFFIGGSTVVGMQVGVVVGSIQAVSTVQTMPEESQRRVMKAIREVQVEQQDKLRRGGPLSEGRVWEQKTTADGGDVPQPGISDSINREEQKTSGAVYNGPGPIPGPREVPGQQTSVWQQLRTENGGRPQTAWEKLRSGRNPQARSTDMDTDTESMAADPFSTDANAAEATRHVEASGRFEAQGSSGSHGREQSQAEFDRLLEQERDGLGVDSVEAGSRPPMSKQNRRNKFGDVEA